MVEFTGVQTRQVTVYHLREYLAKEKNRGICDTTLENERQIFCGYFNWLQRESLINRNPTANLGAIKCAKKKKLAYSETDLDKLHQVACHETRDRAIISFLESTGCRISEALELNRDDVDLERQKCIVHGKGNKERTVYLNDVTTMVLKQYLEERKDQNEALFVSLRGDHERLQPGGVRIMLKRIGKKAGVENVHPHRFRRTLATNISRHGMPIQEVATILGHEKLDTTMKYVSLNDNDVHSDFRRFAS